MNFLLDTHSFIWFIEDNPSLSAQARIIIEEPSNDLLLSIASVWEMAIKVSLGKLQIRQSFDRFIPDQLMLNNINLLDITISHTLHIATLPFHHRDPFDRLLIAQSLIEGIPLISIDTLFDTYGVSRLW